MTVELAAGIPVFIAIAFVVFNAMLFMENCAAFDRLAKDAVRTYAASPAHGQTLDDSVALVQESLRRSFSYDYVSVSVEAHKSALGLATFTATLRFTPTLFGRSFSGSVFGVDMWSPSHAVQMTVDPYRPGVVV